MKANNIELVFILDKSGSMAGLESDTLGGFNSMLKKQKNKEGEAKITTILFNNTTSIIHDRFDIEDVSPLTEDDYFAGGSTALLDAVGNAIKKVENIQNRLPASKKSDKVMFVIITDGLENASRQYSYHKIKQMIESTKESMGWEYIFLGANIDAVDVAGSIGIRGDRAANYHADARGLRKSYSTVNDAVSSMRECCAMPKNWKDEIDKDYKSRK